MPDEGAFLLAARPRCGKDFSPKRGSSRHPPQLHFRKYFDTEYSMLNSYRQTFPQPGNLLIPPIRSRLAPGDIQTFSKLAIQSQLVRDLFSELGIRIAPLSTFSTLLDYSKEISAEWDSGQGQSQSSMARMITVLRIIDAITAAGRTPAAIQCLHKVARNNVDLGQTGESKGKDALWELSLHKQLNDKQIKTRLDEPDLVASLTLGELPIACKKIYSENNLDVQLKKGARQLKPFNGVGLIALDIDDLFQREPQFSTKTWLDVASFNDADCRGLICLDTSIGGKSTI